MSNRATATRAERELEDLFDELDTLLKNNEVGADLASKGVNVALALTAAEGLRAYVRGDKIAALTDLGTVVEEIATRTGVNE